MPLKNGAITHLFASELFERRRERFHDLSSLAGQSNSRCVETISEYAQHHICQEFQSRCTLSRTSGERVSTLLLFPIITPSQLKTAPELSCLN